MVHRSTVPVTKRLDGRARVLQLPLLAALVLVGLPAWADCKLRSMELPIRLVNSRPVATVGINGVDVPMLLDSGAFYSMLPESTAAELKLPLTNLPSDIRVDGHTGRIDTKLTRVNKVRLQSAEIPNVEFIVGGTELGSGLKGILGRNFLNAGDTEYDLANGVVRLVFPLGDCGDTNLAYWAGDKPVISTPLERRDTSITAPVYVNGRKFLALLDTGAPVTTMKIRAARRAGIEEQEMTLVGSAGGADGGRVRSWRANVKDFEFGGEKIANNEFSIDETSKGDNYDMLIGLDYFLAHRIYVSKQQNRIYATWNGGPVFARAAAGTPSADGGPTSAEGLANRAAAAVTRGDYASALADLNRACELAPTAALHFQARSRVKLALRQPREALKDLDEAVRLDPGLGDARVARAGLRLAFADKTGAEADLQELDATLSPSAHLRMSMASLYAQLGLAPAALRQWDLWLPTHGSDASLPSALGQRCWLRARFNMELPQALEDCKQAISKDGAEPAYRSSLGWVLLRQGDAAGAGKAFDASIGTKPSPWAHYGRAIALRRLGNDAGAELDLASARKLRPQIDEDVRKAGFGALVSGSAT